VGLSLGFPIFKPYNPNFGTFFSNSRIFKHDSKIKSLVPCTHSVFLKVTIHCIGIAIYNNAPKMWASSPFSE
jgi:hypothetical protein